MLKDLRDILTRTLSDSPARDPEAREHSLRLATAALLVEVVRADYEEELSESEVVLEQLQRFFDLTEAETVLLMREAEREADEAVSLQSFTRLLHEQLSANEKHAVVEMLWKVALADERLDKHEDHLVRKVAGLLYVSHGDLIRIRNRIRSEES
jgi:uncharacterized tellurite resistance protein B-like protein